MSVPGVGKVNERPRLPFLDEALAAREARRARRWLRTSRMPLLYALGSILLPWGVVPALYSTLSGGNDQLTLQRQPHWMFLTLALTLVGGGMAAAFAHVSKLWHTERVRQTLEGWLLARQEPGPVVTTASLSGAALALVVSFPAALLLGAASRHFGIPPRQVLLTWGLLLLGAGLAAAAATAAFFLTSSSPAQSPSAPSSVPPCLGFPRRRVIDSLRLVRIFAPSRFRLLVDSLPFALCLLTILALWLRIEAVEHGWNRAWEEHPGRLLLAAGLLTPAPALFGFADRRWWVFGVAERLDYPLSPEAAAMLLLLLYAVATSLLLRGSERAYRALRARPERGARAPLPLPAGEEARPVGSRGYWAGFANPVWTRELRTRLRGREAPQFLFFASVALAVGGFTPLVSAAGQLGDPLALAAVARAVFFWLAMILGAMLALIAPGLTAEAIGGERTRGTLEMLLATPLRRPEILRGKLLGDLSVLALLVSPSLPLFGFCYLFHGATGPQVLAVFAVLALIAALCALLGVTASATQPTAMAAKWQAYLLSLLACGFFGGPLWLLAALASAGPGFTSFALTTPILLLFYTFLLSALWSRACDRLESADPATDEVMR